MSDAPRNGSSSTPGTPSVSARDWREAWRAARDSAGQPFPEPGTPGPGAPASDVGTSRWTTAGAQAGAPVGAPGVEPGPFAPVDTTPRPAADRPRGRRARVEQPASDRSASDQAASDQAASDQAAQPGRVGVARRADEPSSWLPNGHSAPAGAHASAPGGMVLPGADPEASRPPLVVGALPGEAADGPYVDPADTEAGTRGGFRSALAEGVAKAKAKRAELKAASQASAAERAASAAAAGSATSGGTFEHPTAVSPQPTSPANGRNAVGQSGPAAGSIGSERPDRPDPLTEVGAVEQPHDPHPTPFDGAAAATLTPPGTDTGTQPLAPFASPTGGPGGPAPVAPTPGFSPVAAPGYGAAAGAGSISAATAAGIAAASSATVTDQTATLGGAPTTVIPATGVPASPPSSPRTSNRPPSGPRKPPRPARDIRRAHLKLSRIDPWTIMKVSFMLAIAFGIMTVVSVFVIWSMLDAAGVFTSIAENVQSVTGDGAEAGGVDILEWVALDRVLGVATLLAVVDVVLITALATLGAFLYNLASTLLGGVEVTLVEDHR